MVPTDALHTAARRYCAERAAEWGRRYTELRAREDEERRRAGISEPVTYTYWAEALATFPRYQVLYAIQAEVETFTPDDFASTSEARKLLAAAGASAESVFTRPPTGDAEQEAMDEERRLFADYVNRLSEEELAQVEPLPFRRRLRQEESQRLWSELETRWGLKGSWYPLDRPDTAEAPPHTAAFEAESFFDERVQGKLRGVLAESDVSRLWELRELDIECEYELDIVLFEPTYNGSEGFWTDSSFEWLVYASHEGSVTVSGAELLPALQAAWPAWRDWTYHGWR